MKRPPSLVAIRRDAIQRFSDSGSTPLDVMLTAMRRHFEMYNRYEAMVSVTKDESEKEKFNAKRLEYLDRAVSAAKDAAPYLHPRLATTTIKGDREAPVCIEMDRPEELKQLVRGAG